MSGYATREYQSLLIAYQETKHERDKALARMAALEAERETLRRALGAYRSALRSREPETPAMAALAAKALAAVAAANPEETP